MTDDQREAIAKAMRSLGHTTWAQTYELIDLLEEKGFFGTVEVSKANTPITTEHDFDKWFDEVSLEDRMNGKQPHSHYAKKAWDFLTTSKKLNPIAVCRKKDIARIDEQGCLILVCTPPAPFTDWVTLYV